MADSQTAAHLRERVSLERFGVRLASGRGSRAGRVYHGGGARGHPGPTFGRSMRGDSAGRPPRSHAGGSGETWSGWVGGTNTPPMSRWQVGHWCASWSQSHSCRCTASVIPVAWARKTLVSTKTARKRVMGNPVLRSNIKRSVRGVPGQVKRVAEGVAGKPAFGAVILRGGARPAPAGRTCPCRHSPGGVPKSFQDAYQSPSVRPQEASAPRKRRHGVQSASRGLPLRTQPGWHGPTPIGPWGDWTITGQLSRRMPMPSGLCACQELTVIVLRDWRTLFRKVRPRSRTMKRRSAPGTPPTRSAISAARSHHRSGQLNASLLSPGLQGAEVRHPPCPGIRIPRLEAFLALFATGWAVAIASEASAARAAARAGGAAG